MLEPVLGCPLVHWTRYPGFIKADQSFMNVLVYFCVCLFVCCLGFCLTNWLAIHWSRCWFVTGPSCSTLTPSSNSPPTTGSTTPSPWQRRTSGCPTSWKLQVPTHRWPEIVPLQAQQTHLYKPITRRIHLNKPITRRIHLNKPIRTRCNVDQLHAPCSTQSHSTKCFV